MAYYGLLLRAALLFIPFSGVYRGNMIVCGQNFTLEMKELQLCRVTSENSSVSLYQSDILAIQEDLTHCNSSSWIMENYNVSQCMQH